MKSFLAPCTAIFLLSASIAGASPIPSGNHAYAIRDIIFEPHTFPPEGSGDMDLWDGFGDDIHRSGVIDEGLVSRFTNSLVPESKKLESVDEVASRLLSMSAGAQHTNGANGAHPPINGAVSAPMSEGGANSATHEAAVTLASLTGGTNGPDREAALALVSMTGSANHRPPPSTDHVPLHMASSTSNT